MSNILTPNAMWGAFDDSSQINPQTLSSFEEDGTVFECVAFDGRDTGAGRVRIYAELAYSASEPQSETVLILPDSCETVDRELLKFFVGHGYSAMMVDLRGEWEGAENYTRYPENVSYANLKYCGRTKDYVDDSADKTCWYEWVAVGVFARKYIAERTNTENIALIGLRDGGEVAWKLASIRKFLCLVPVSSAGWKAYAGISKYTAEEPQMDEERYRFIAGIDSQAYAAGVKCPVFMLCSVNDERFDYDRAHDTFSRINPEYIYDSVTAYSMNGNSYIASDCIDDLWMFLNKYLKRRHVFLPKPASVSVTADENENLIAAVSFDEAGIAEDFAVYLAEDCVDSALREWTPCKNASGKKNAFLLDIYEKTSTVFVLASVKYTNGFTAWSKIVVKKISGRFRNMQPKSAIMYSDRYGTDGFSVANRAHALGGIILIDKDSRPELVEKNGVRGVYAEGGISTCRMNDPRYSPSEGSVLKLDVFCDNDCEFNLTLGNLSTGEKYVYTVWVVGGVWQTVIAESKNFKTQNGISLQDFSGQLRLNLNCGTGYAVNNVMWL